MADVRQEPMIVRGRGTFTPPPAPCGGADCQYQGLEVVHAGDCPEKEDE